MKARITKAQLESLLAVMSGLGVEEMDFATEDPLQPIESIERDEVEVDPIEEEYLKPSDTITPPNLFPEPPHKIEEMDSRLGYRYCPVIDGNPAVPTEVIDKINELIREHNKRV